MCASHFLKLHKTGLAKKLTQQFKTKWQSLVRRRWCRLQKNKKKKIYIKQKFFGFKKNILFYLNYQFSDENITLQIAIISWTNILNRITMWYNRNFSGKELDHIFLYKSNHLNLFNRKTLKSSKSVQRRTKR
jgi:hypothetical protein